MGISDCSIYLKIAVPLLIVTLLLQILGLALPFWYLMDGNNYKYYGGLFRYCVEIGNTDSCKSYSDLTSWWEATQAFEILGMLLILGALIVTLLVIFVMSDMKLLKLTAWALSFTASAFILIGICIYGGEASGTFKEYSGAFGITIVAGILALVCGILGLLDWMGFKVA